MNAIPIDTTGLCRFNVATFPQDGAGSDSLRYVIDLFSDQGMITTIPSRSVAVEFTAHNVRLADGAYTKPYEQYKIDSHPGFLSVKEVLTALYPEKQLERACGGSGLSGRRIRSGVLATRIRDDGNQSAQFESRRL